jgi:Flp pilus assembly protein TadG
MPLARLEAPSNSRSEKGQVLIEFALVLPLLLLLLFGIIEFGRAFFQKNMTINAAREGARFAAVQTTWNIGKITAAAKAPITPESLKTGATVVVVPQSKPSTGGSVQVTVTTGFKTILPRLILPLGASTGISASATMRYEH